MATPDADIVRYANTGLFVVPSRHGDLVFGDLLLTAARDDFDAYVVELPRNIEPAAIAHAVETLGYAPGVAICGATAPVATDGWPEDDPDGRPGPKWVTKHCTVVPLVPGDSIVAAIQSYLRARRAGRDVTLELIDLDQHAGRRPQAPDLTAADTWLVRRKGLRSYLETMTDRLDAGRAPRDDARELAMAASLRRLIDAGRKILFVCGLAHWRRIEALLDAGPHVLEGAGPVPAPPVPVDVVSIPAAQAWALGWMGIPALVAEWVRHVQSDSNDRFDLPAAVSRLKQEALAEAQQTRSAAATARQILTWELYLKSRMVLGGRWTPQLDGDLCHAAESCIGNPEWVSMFKAVALRYPFERRPPACTRGRVVEHDDTLYFVAGQSAYALGPASRGTDDGVESRTLPKAPRPLSREERSRAKALGCVRSEPSEDRLFGAVVHHAWMLADLLCDERRRRAANARTAPFSGDLGLGIDWRRTVRRAAEGGTDDEVYVRIAARRGSVSRPRLERGPSRRQPTPCNVAWIFSPDAAIEHCAAGSVGVGGVYSSFYFLSHATRLAAGVGREIIGYSATLLRCRTDWTEKSVRRLVESLPASQLAHVTPWRDPELRDSFAGPDLAVAAAIKYAGDRAIIVADERFRLGLDVQAYARRRGVTLIALAWSLFGDATRDRLALQHTCPSETPFTDPPSFILRLIPPVPEFNPPRSGIV